MGDYYRYDLQLYCEPTEEGKKEICQIVDWWNKFIEVLKEKIVIEEKLCYFTKSNVLGVYISELNVETIKGMFRDTKELRGCLKLVDGHNNTTVFPVSRNAEEHKKQITKVLVDYFCNLQMEFTPSARDIKTLILNKYSYFPPTTDNELFVCKHNCVECGGFDFEPVRTLISSICKLAFKCKSCGAFYRVNAIITDVEEIQNKEGDIIFPLTETTS